MLSIIVCSVSPERLHQLGQNIQDTIDVEYEIVSIDNREKGWPIARAYNEGARQACYPNLFFVHEDVKFHTRGWGIIIEEKLTEPDCGVIGFAGNKIKFKSYSGWQSNPEWAHAFFMQRVENIVKFEVYNAFLEHSFGEVITLDGLGLFVRKEVWEIYPFDEKILTGFHCYDLDFSLQIAASRKYKNYVCCTPKILIEHFSMGNYNQGWYEDTIRLHKLKWNKFLPLKVEGLELSKRKEKKLEERYYNLFVRDILKADYPKRWMVLKEFMCSSFSWRHIRNCATDLYQYIKI